MLGALALRRNEPISRSTRCPASRSRLPLSPRHTNLHARTQRSRKLAHHGGLVVLAEGVRGVAREELEHSCAHTRRWDVRTRTGRIARVTATHCPRRLTPRVPAGRAPRRDRTPNEAVCARIAPILATHIATQYARRSSSVPCDLLCAAAQATQHMLARDAARSLSSTLPEIDVCVPQIAERIEQCFSLLTFSFFSSTRTGRCPPSNLSGAPRRRMPAVRPSMRKPRGREAVLMPALCADIRSSAGSPVGGQTKCEGGQQTRLRHAVCWYAGVQHDQHPTPS